MSLQGITNTALSGMQAQTARLGVTASNIANSQTPGYNRLTAQIISAPGGVIIATSDESPAVPGGNDIDLASELLDAVRAGIEFKANAVVFEAGADLWDVLKTINRD